MKGLVDNGQIKARTKWKEVYPLFQDDERYLNMLGNPGSNPIELFWDVVDGLDQALDAKIVVVEDAIKRYNEKAPKDGNGEVAVFNLKPETTWDQFSTVVKAEADSAVNALTEEELGIIFKAVCLRSFRVLIANTVLVAATRCCQEVGGREKEVGAPTTSFAG